MSEYGITKTQDDDPEMEAASKEARRTFRFFWREMAWEYRRIIPALDIAAVKGAFSDPPEKRSQDPDALSVEHMWVSNVRFDGKQVTGSLLNSPHSLTSYSEGDEVMLKPADVSDWMYSQDSTVYGAFTVNLLRQRMGKSERKSHDSAWGLDFGDPEIVHVVPPEYLGDSVPKKGFMSRFRKQAQQPQDFALATQQEHPMSDAMGEGLQKALKQNPETASEPDEEGFTYLHQLALAGSLAGVNVLLDHGVDVNHKTSHGMTAYRLAKTLGWQKVMKRLTEAGAEAA